MALISYNKPHATATARIAHLQARGLHVADPADAAHKIEMIGYERLRIYFLSRRDSTLPNRPFRPGTTYSDILSLYECDARLRDICFAAVGQFELLLRNAISEAVSHAHGSHPYYDVSAFRDPAANLEALQTFIGVYGRSKDPRAKHYRQTYGEPVLPPIWTMKEFLTFGASSKIFQHLSGTLRTSVALQFGVRKDEVFSNWLDCLVDLRNICAHHDRLFNRSFPKQPKKLQSAHLPTAPINKLKAILECLDYLLTQRGARSQIVTDVAAAIAACPTMAPGEAGYP